MNRIISREELVRRLEAKEHIVVGEVLGLEYFRRGHIPTAVPMPPASVLQVAHAVAPERTRPIVLYCASVTCQNSHVAAEALTQAGYTDVRVFAGGKAEWQDAGLPIVTEEAA